MKNRVEKLSTLVLNSKFIYVNLTSEVLQSETHRNSNTPYFKTYFRFTTASSFVSWSLRAGIALASFDTAIKKSFKNKNSNGGRF